MPPSLEELKKRLISRGTDSEESISKRLDKAEYEMTFAPQFDKVIINDNLISAIEDVKREIKDFIS